MARTLKGAQLDAVNDRGSSLIVSASAGTGKTTVMIERIVKLIKERAVDIDRLLVVTFTTAAATEMKDRLKAQLSDTDDQILIEQAEKLDSCQISTLHSFCADVLRNYFYVTGIDPNFTILETEVAQGLRDRALTDTFNGFLTDEDENFEQLENIFSSRRSDSELRKVVMKIYDFANCQGDFDGWWQNKRQYYLSDDNGFVKALNKDLCDKFNAYSGFFEKEATYCKNAGNAAAAKLFQTFADNVRLNGDNSYFSNREIIFNATFPSITKKAQYQEGLSVSQEEYDTHFESVKAVRSKLSQDISKEKKQFGQATAEQLLSENRECLPLLDKLIEVSKVFADKYSQLKKERSTLDFNDLEQLTKQTLNDEETLLQIRSKYQSIFVDEYQDTNGVQEAILEKLKTDCNQFFVGDVKQSIYGFRLCDPEIFVEKCAKFEKGCGKVIRLNENFRSDKSILDFTNGIFCKVMTDSFGKVEYAKQAMLYGVTQVATQLPKITVDEIRSSRTNEVVDKEYDIDGDTDPSEDYAEAEVVVKRIRETVGSAVTVNGEKKILSYGDIAVLLPDMKVKSRTIYDKLVSCDIPVVATFADEMRTKECLDLINFLRALDNPYNDVYLVGTALSFFGKFDENQLGEIKINASGRNFYEIMSNYRAANKDELAGKIEYFFNFLDRYRNYSFTMSVDELLQQLVVETDYLLRVQSLSNGSFRYLKVVSMIASAQNKSYAQSIDKYLRYIDESQGEVDYNSATAVKDAVRLTTIHKSKGLEYGVVICANLGKSFNSNYGEAKIVTDKDTGIAFKHYNIATKTVRNTLSYAAADKAEKYKSKEERARLLYVLFTRAKYRLCLIYTDKSDRTMLSPAFADSMADWVKYSLDGIEGVEYNLIDKDALSQSDATLPTPIPLPPQSTAIEGLDYVYPYLNTIKTPLKVVSSQLRSDTLAVETDDEAYVKRCVPLCDNASLVGTAYHRLLEQLHVDSTAEQAEQVKNALKEEFEDEVLANVDVTKALKVLHNKEFIDLVNYGKVYHEVPFMVNAPYNAIYPESDNANEVVLQGIIDMLVIGKDKATVIDFKYTSHSDRIARNYTPQITSYALATKKILRIDQVEGYAVSISDNKIVKIV